MPPDALWEASQEKQVALSEQMQKAWVAAAGDAVPSAVEAFRGAAERGDPAFLQALAAQNVLTDRLGGTNGKPITTSAQEDDGAVQIAEVWELYQVWALEEAYNALAGELGVPLSVLQEREPQLREFGASSSRTLMTHVAYAGSIFFAAHLATRTNAVIREVAEQGVAGQAASVAARTDVLRVSLVRELGVVAGGPTDLASGIAARYAGNPALYFDGVTHNAIHQARMFSTVRSFSEVGQFRARPIGYTIENPNDRRTGPICRQLSGQHFLVDDGMSVMNRTLLVDPADIASVAPWYSNAQMTQILEGTTPGSEDARTRLVAAGAVLPPFHLACRSTIAIDP